MIVRVIVRVIMTRGQPPLVLVYIIDYTTNSLEHLLLTSNNVNALAPLVKSSVLIFCSHELVLISTLGTACVAAHNGEISLNVSVCVEGCLLRGFLYTMLICNNT